MMYFARGTLFTLVAAFAVACGGYEGDFEGELEGEPGAEAAGEEVQTQDALFGSDACKNIDINITNSYEDGVRSTRILVRKIEFYSQSEGRYLSEDLPNTEIAYNSDAWFWNQDLAYAENDTLSSARVTFSYLESDGDWSDNVTQWIDITNDVCHEDDNYYVTVD